MAKASEFGGSGNQPNGVMPPPHVPTASEQLMLTYRTGDPSGLSPVDTEHAAWNGLLPFEEQKAIRQAAGDLDVGQLWQEMIDQASAELSALQQEVKR
jgi:hypothetical protein